jgi:hypothetical protein
MVAPVAATNAPVVAGPNAAAQAKALATYEDAFRFLHPETP